MASILEERCHVALRLRARTQQEIMREDPPVWTIKPPSTLRVDPHLVSNPGAADRCEFAFSECYSQDADNEQVYDRSVRHLTLAAQKGVTGLVLVYGQHSAGKAHTVRGQELAGRSRSQLGIVSQAAIDLLREKQQKQQFVRLSAFALYNEQFYDLLCQDPSILKEPLEMQEQARFKKASSHGLLHKQSTLRDDQQIEIPMLSSQCGARQELMKSEEEVLTLLRRVKESQRFLQDKGIVEPLHTHYIFQFNLTRINRSSSMSPGPGLRGSSPSFGRQDEPTDSYPYKTSAFRPYSQQGQAKPPSFSAAESNPFSSETSKRVSISQSTLNIIQCAACDGLVSRDTQASARELRSLDALWSCISTGTARVDSRISPLLKPIERRGHILCSVIVCVAPTLSEIKAAFHSVKFGHKALKLFFKPESNILQSESSIASLLEQYERALALKSRSTPKSIYSSATSTSRTGGVAKRNTLVKSSRHSPAPPSPRGESPRSAMLVGQIKHLQQRVIQQNKKLFIQNSHLQYYFNHAKTHARSYHLLPPTFAREVQTTDALHLAKVGAVEPARVLKRKLVMKAEKHGAGGAVQTGVLVQALRNKEVAMARAKEQQIYMLQEIKQGREEREGLVQKLRQMKQMMDQKEFFLQKVKQSLNFHKQRGDIMRCKLEFFESLNPHLLARINDEQIHALENHYSYLQQRLKEEKARRIYKNKIDSLKEKIKELKDAEDRRRLERVDTPGAPPQSQCNRTQDSILQDMLNSSLRGLQDPNLNQLPQDSGILNSSQVSYMTDPYLQIPVDDPSFEDSAITPDDSVNASPFQKFAADNQHFQKIFSELFLGGQESRDQGDESRQEEEEKEKPPPKGRRQTAEKIVDDISYLDEGGASVYTEVEKILEQPAVSTRPPSAQKSTTATDLEEFLKKSQFKPSEHLQRMEERLDGTVYENLHDQALDQMSLTIGRKVGGGGEILIQEQPESVEEIQDGAQEVITLPSEMIFSPRLLNSQKASARNSSHQSKRGLPHEPSGFQTEQTSWSELALDQELKELEFETRGGPEQSIAGLKSRNGLLGSKTEGPRNFQKLERYGSSKHIEEMPPSSTISSHHSSSEHSSRGSKVNLVLRQDLAPSFKRDGKIPPRAGLKVVPPNKIAVGFGKSGYDLISPKSALQTSSMAVLSRSAASSAQSSRKELQMIRLTVEKEASFTSNDRSVELSFQKIQKKLGGKGSSKVEKKLAKQIVHLKQRPGGRLPSPNMSTPALINDLSLHSQSHFIQRSKPQVQPQPPQANPSQSAKLLSAKGKYPEHSKKLKNLILEQKLDKSLTHHPMTPTGTAKASLKIGAMTSGKKGSLKAYGMLAGLAAGAQPVKKK